MKSLTAVCQTGASMPAIKATAAAHNNTTATLNGRIQRHPRHRNADGENAEMKMYLSKLKDLVPFMPKRKLSKLEIIQHVIDYICDLQTELETHPEIGNFDAATALSFANAHAAAASTDDDDDVAASAAADAQHADAGDRLTPTERLAIEAMQQQQHLQYMQHQRQHNHQQSSPAASMRQPLVDRQTPNTILPTAAANTITTTATATPLMSLQMQMPSQHQHQQPTTATVS